MKRYAIIVAGGKGTRMRNDIPKQFIEIAGKPILAHTIENFYRFDPNIDLIIVLPQNQQEYWKRLCTVHRITIPHLVVKGGETRFHSVLNGLSLIPDEGIVAIHDGTPAHGSSRNRKLFSCRRRKRRSHTRSSSNRFIKTNISRQIQQGRRPHGIRGCTNSADIPGRRNKKGIQAPL
jgi:CTP:molybdopterin cytidylyltransferase MocA